MIKAYTQLFKKIPRKLFVMWLLLIPLSLMSAVLESVVMTMIYFTVQYLNKVDVSGIPGVLSFISELSFSGIAAVLVGLFLIKNTTLIIFWISRNFLASHTQNFLSHNLLKNYLSQTYLFHLQHNSSELIRNTIDSVDQVCLLGLNGFFTLINYAFIAIAVFIMLIVLSPLGGLVIMSITATLVLTAYLLSRAYLKKQSQQSEMAKKNRLRILSELFKNYRELHISGKEIYWTNRFLENQSQYTNSYARGMSLTSATSLSMEILLVAALMTLAGSLVFTDTQGSEVLFPLLGAYAYGVARVIPIISGLSLNLGMVQYAHEPLQNILPYLDQPLEKGDQHTISPSAPNNIIVSELSYTYPNKEQPVFQNLSFEIAAGQCVGIKGSSGQGKSTLMMILLGLLENYSGSIKVLGNDLKSIPHAWKKAIAYVPQEVLLLDDTITANIAYGHTHIDHERIALILQQTHLDKLVEELGHGLDTQIGEHGMELSGGQRQRIAIARALYEQPDYLFLDEPTSSLDSDTEQNLLETLRSLHGKINLILITHSDSVLQQCDQIIDLNET